MVEDGNALLADIHERISYMMQEKVEAVKVLTVTQSVSKPLIW